MVRECVGDTAMGRIGSKLNWRLRRQWFFVQQRLFYFVSALLLDNRTGGRVRAMLLRAMGAKVGSDCFIRGSLQLQEGVNLTIGSQVFINAGCCLDTSAPITFEDRVQVSFQVTFVTGGHAIGEHASRAGAHAPAPIRVGEGAWIGARATILPGVVIGAGSVVAAGAVVTRDVEPDTVVAGVPAKKIRDLAA